MEIKWKSNGMGGWIKYAGFHTPKAVTYHEPTVMWLFMIGHSLGRVGTFFARSNGAGSKTHLKSSFGAILIKGGDAIN